MKTGRIFGLGLVGGLLLVAGCGDKEMEARSREQQVRITELQAKVDLLNARLGDREGGDPGEDLRKAQKAMAETQQRVEELRTELADLTKKRSDLEKEFEAYRRKYRLPE